ncbi:MAG TPA: ribonuclease III [bacterium]|nr:ribonuclease III [bacterium]HOL46634.1 ribonuclease III [bacterium]
MKEELVLTPEKKEKIQQLQREIRYNFNDLSLLIKALTHKSYVNEHKKLKIKDNERLEFLGDSVLSLVISEYLFLEFKDKREGELAKIHSSIVSSKTLCRKSKEINLGEYIFLGKGEEATGGRKRFSILTNVYEALIGAIFLDSDYNTIKKFILNNFSEEIKDIIEKKNYIDYKSFLQEYTQAKYKERPIYVLIKEEGPEHSKIFTVDVKINNKTYGTGTGKTKKEAEQNAAEKALVKLNII